MKQSLIEHACNCFTNAWVPLSKSVEAMATYFRLRWERHLIYTWGQLQFYGRLEACIFREIFSSLFNMHLSKVNYYNQTFFHCSIIALSKAQCSLAIYHNIKFYPDDQLMGSVFHYQSTHVFDQKKIDGFC